MSLERIVVGVATLDTVDPVLGPAVELAGALGAELHLIHALVDAGAARGGVAAEARRRAASLLEAQLDTMIERTPVHLHLPDGVPDQVLAWEARRLEADLLVTGPTRRGALGRAVLGTTAQQLLREAEVPVLVLRRPMPRAGLRALLTSDLSPLSEEAHVRGVALARGLAAGLDPTLVSLFVLTESLRPEDHTRREEEAALAAEFTRFVSTHTPPGVEVSTRIRKGNPGREILALASEWEADLVVVGTHARRGAARLLLGSVAEEVIRGARGNVLVLPASSMRANRKIRQPSA